MLLFLQWDTTAHNQAGDYPLQGQRDVLAVGKLILSELAPVVSAQHGVFYIMSNRDDAPRLKLLASYALSGGNGVKLNFKLGEGLIGQAALEKQRILLADVPTDYVRVTSGLGESRPINIVVLPILFEGEVKAVMGTFVARSFQPDAPGISRSTCGKHRHRLAHD